MKLLKNRSNVVDRAGSGDASCRVLDQLRFVDGFEREKQLCALSDFINVI